MTVLNPTETLTSGDIPSVGAATDAFGIDTSLLVARPGRTCCNYLWFTVPEGFYALVTRHGADVDFEPGNPVWPAGLHVGPPWLKVSHLVSRQSMMFNTPVRGCKTKDNVTVQIDVALVLRVMGEDPSVRPGDDPANVRRFVHEVTARGLEKQLNDAQAEAVRTLARSVAHTEVYGLRSVGTEELGGVREKLFAAAAPPTAVVPPPPTFGAAEPPVGAPSGGGGGDAGSGGSQRAGRRVQFEPPIAPEEVEGDEEEERDLVGEHDPMDDDEALFNVERGGNVCDIMKARLNAQFRPQGVEILDVIIQQISLPQDIEEQMSQKTMVISQNAEQRMQQKYDMQELQQAEETKTLKQSFGERKLELRKDGEMRAQQESNHLAHERAEGQRTLRQINTQMRVDVAAVNAESSRAIRQIRDRTALETGRIALSSEAEASKGMADARATVQDVEAKAELACAVLSSKGDKVVFHAHGVSAPKNRAVNDHETNLKKIQAQASLASNEKLVIVGTSGGAAANQLLMADAALAHARTGFATDSARAGMLSELAVASGKAIVRLDVGDEKM